jgi:D-serine deaminase-like pyridoxal phosphate-dependent protein
MSERHVSGLDTPCLVVDEAIVERNIQRFQEYCDQHGLLLRPHIKTHKIPAMAERQLQAGAVGINCQKVSEAEVFAAAGCDDILITFNILGAEKLARLVALNDKVKLSVVADSTETVRQLSQAFADQERPIRVLVECDTGAGRCGVQSPEQALQLAKLLREAPGTEFTGLLTYPSPSMTEEANQWLMKARTLCIEAGLPPQVISTGGTPGMFRAHQFTVATEYRVGTYIYNDRSLVEYGLCEFDDCALTVLTTVVSRPTEDRGVIDAGTKTLTSDLLGMEGYGWVKEYPDARIYALSEEHGCIDFSACEQKPEIGEKLNIIPNHVCVVSNMFDSVYLKKDQLVEESIAVAARGKVW